ncbi:MAG: hypothetical protein EXR79_14775 [Myxococcales bacterium]|nr:hypothetical protein [Myxococcales bacterium]
MELHMFMKSNRFGALMTGVAMVVLVGLAGCKGGKSAVEQAGAGTPHGPGIDTPAMGSDAPKVEVFAFVGFECDFCRGQAQALQELADKHKAYIRVRMINLPLDVHAHSLDGAKGAVAAHKQGAYWQFYKKFMADVPMSREAVIAWAVEAGLDAKKLAADFDAPATLDTVKRDVGLAKVFGVSGTPSFVVNGQLIQGVQPKEYWDKKIAEELARAEALLASGTRKEGLIGAIVAAVNPKLAVDYARYVLKGEKPPEAPVPAPVARSSGVASAQIQPAGGGTGAIQVGEPVQLNPEAGDPNTVWRVALRPDDPAQGPAGALVTLVVFEDMECPFCAKLQTALRSLRTHYPDKLRVVFKHNPLPFHKQAELAANAIEAARQQGKFWEFHDRLLAAQDKLTDADLKTHADALKLDRSKFDTLLAASGGRERIEADMEQAAALGARGTPNIFINGKKLVGAKEEALLKQVIDAELAAAEKLVAAGTPAAGVYEAVVGKGKLLDSLGSDAATFDATVGANRGLAGAAIRIVTFQDFQCPFSARLDPHIAEIEKEFAGRVQVAWVDFPLTDIHPMAQVFAEAGHEARKQGKFWPFHAAVMADNGKLDEAVLFQRAKQAGLDGKALKSALDKHVHAAAVAAERALGTAAGVKGTPSVFINGHAFVPQSGFNANTFRAAVRRLLGTR